MYNVFRNGALGGVLLAGAVALGCGNLHADTTTGAPPSFTKPSSPPNSIGAVAPRWLTYDAHKRQAVLTLIAGDGNALGGFNFNDKGKGKMEVDIPRGYRVVVHFANHGAYPHSVVVTPYALKDDPRYQESAYPSAFKGSASPDSTIGIESGHAVETIVFVAGKVGRYAIVCGVSGHESAGMWDVLKVMAGGTPSYKG